MTSITHKTIQIKSTFFDDEKVKIIESLPNCDEIIIIWFKFLILAQKHNDSGKLMLTPKIPFSEKELSIVFNRPIAIVKQTIEILCSFGEIQINNGIITVLSKITDNVFDRNSPEYRAWRKSVFYRDDFTCKMCGIRGGHIEAHHKKQWAKYVEYRYDVNNGITLCRSCHRKIHRKQGVVNE